METTKKMETKTLELPDGFDGDYNLFMNKLPSSWDFRTGFASEVLEKVRDLIIEEFQKVAEWKTRSQSVEAKQ